MPGPKPQVRYWPSRGSWTDESGQSHAGGWCCWFRGRQRLLAAGPDDFPEGPTYRKAMDAWLELIGLANAETAKDRNTVRTVCEKYLCYLEKHKQPGTVEMRQSSLKPFVEELGETTIQNLLLPRVNRWLDSMKEWRTHPQTGHPTRWNEGSIRNACISLQACFNWAVKNGYATKNPLKGLEQPQARSRGRKALIGINPEEREANHRRVLDACNPPLHRIVVVLHMTGCRPGELIHAKASDFDAARGALVYHADDKRFETEFRHKTAGKDKERVIYLAGEALEIVQQLVKKHPHGLLFRRGKGGWTRKTLGERFRVIRKRTKLPNLTPYSYRHTFATSWLEQGKSIDVLAELIGNTPSVIRKHYSHLLADTANLRRQLESFCAGRTDTATNRTSPSPSASA